ncbi:MAG: hypothetical protein DCC49_07760 [Acidobacteria bacterium]|nr:MAG: hypothetical protein DCC49_07760 [Acidobacteriota bacterium]
MSKLDLSTLNDSRTIAALAVPPASKVLVAGSTNFGLASALAGRACEVWCIEQDKSETSELSRVCRHAIAGNLESVDLHTELGENEFDAILILDALESLRYPEDALRAMRNHLRPAGVVVASAFNVAHATVKLELLDGRFPYTEGGPLDHEHIRFYDKPGIRKLFDGALLGIIDELDVTRPLDEAQLEIARARHSDETIHDALSDCNALTYQFVVFASGAILESPEGMRPDQKGIAALLSRQARSAETQLADAEKRAASAFEQVRELERLLGQMTDDLSEARQSRAETLHVAELERRHLQADLSIKEEYIADIKRRLDDIEVTKARLAKTEEALHELRQVMESSAGYRAADRLHETLNRYPAIHRMARSLARAIARRPR